MLLQVCRLNDNELFLSVLCLPRAQSVLDRVFSEEEFLGHYGIRSLSKVRVCVVLPLAEELVSTSL